MPSIRTTFRVLPGDLVQTKTGRSGVVRAISTGDTAHVIWEDGEDFSIKFCHLTVLAHGCPIPSKHLKKGES